MTKAMITFPENHTNASIYNIVCNILRVNGPLVVHEPQEVKTLVLKHNIIYLKII